MSDYHHDGALERRFKALERDLLLDGGAQISTTRNYNFAIVPYDTKQEFALRRHVSALSDKLRDAGWITATIALSTLLVERVQSMGEDAVASLIARERRLYARDPGRALDHVGEKLIQLVEGREGLAADVAREIEKLALEHPEDRERMVVFIGRAGSLYPFFRTSSLLKHLAGNTHNLPVILLFPGHAVGDTGLSFMHQMPTDHDYRPRIYR